MTTINRKNNARSKLKKPYTTNNKRKNQGRGRHRKNCELVIKLNRPCGLTRERQMDKNVQTTEN